MLKTCPPKRIPMEINSGKNDGDTHRIYDYNREKKYPNLIRVEESFLTIDQSVFTKLKSIHVDDWKNLSTYKILYLSGIKLYPYMHIKHKALAKKLAGKIKVQKENGQYGELINAVKE